MARLLRSCRYGGYVRAADTIHLGEDAHTDFAEVIGHGIVDHPTASPPHHAEGMQQKLGSETLRKNNLLEADSMVGWMEMMWLGKERVCV